MKILKFIKTAFIWVGIVIFLIVLVYRFNLLFKDIDSFANIKQLLGFIFQIIVSLGFYGFIKRKIREYLKEYNNMTKTIFAIIYTEPLILILIWIFNLFSIYAAPIYSVSVTLSELDAKNIKDNNVQVYINDNKINLKKEDGFIYKSSRCYKWGDTLRTNIKVNMKDIYMQTATNWPAFPCKELILGYEINVDIPDPDSVNVYFDQILPKSTKIELKDEQSGTITIRSIHEPFRIKKGSKIKITLSADKYDSEIISHFMVSNDTTIIRQLRPYPAYVNFIAINNAGNEVTGFTVFARESSNNNQGKWVPKGVSGSPIQLQSEKKWEFYLAKRRNNGDSLETNQFKMRLKAGGEVNKSLVYQIVN